MNVGSLFSGIGGLDHGLARAGFRHAFLCESDPWRRDVLAHHFPGVPIYEDVAVVALELERRHSGTGLADAEEPCDGRESAVDLLCGGFPCQDVSVAGRRAGLAGERSGLFYEFARIAESLRPRWILVENVPGLLSSNGGRDFGAILGTLADIGYGLAWRILDSRYFGVPQRRRRVFVLGALAERDPRGAAERAGEILAVGTRCERHPATRAEAGQGVADAPLRGPGSGGPDDNDGQGGRLVNAWALGSHAGSDGKASNLSHAKGGPVGMGIRENEIPALRAGRTQAIAAPLEAADGHHGYSSPRGDSHGSNPNSNMAGRRREDDENLVSFDAEYSNQASLGDDKAVLTRKLKRAISSESQGVRRLTPRECERLQFLPDDWTDFGPDSRRYAALGDAVTASVGEWIGRALIRAEPSA